MNCVVDSGVIADRPSALGYLTSEACHNLIRLANGVPVVRDRVIVGAVRGARMSDPDGMLPGHVILELEIRTGRAPVASAPRLIQSLTSYDEQGRIVDARFAAVDIK